MNTASSLSDQLMAQLDGAPMQALSQQLGTDTTQTATAVSAALPLLFGAMGRNAEQQGGAESLMQALQRDHAGGGGVADMLSAALGGGGGGGRNDGAAILGHIFGGAQQQRVESGLGQATGLGANAGNLLQTLAPIVMAFLAQRVQSSHLDAGGLGQSLNEERRQAQQQGGLAGGLLGSLLDQDGDGQVGLSDLVKIGGSLFGGRR